eukprot:Colp12_sorted_trinity150504_noHs@3496
MKPLVFIETLPNLKTYQVSVEVTSAENQNVIVRPDAIYVSTNGYSGRVFESAQIFETESLVLQETKEENVLHFKVQTAPDPNERISHEKPAYTTHDIYNYKSIKFCCRACGFPISSTEKFNRVLPLPSEHWSELVDCWVCHDQSHRHMIKEITSKANACLVGESYCLLDKHDIISNNVSCKYEDNDPKAVKRHWRTLICNRCRSSVGLGLLGPDNQELLSVKVFKHCVRTSVYEDYAAETTSRLVTRDAFSSESLSSFVANQLIANTKTHASYKVVVTDFVEGGGKPRPYMLLWLLSWSSEMQTNAASPSNAFPGLPEDSYFTAPQTLTRAVKVLYKQTVQEDLETLRLRQEWERDEGVCVLELEREACLQLLTYLSASSLSLPPSKRNLRGFAVGFLLLGT